MINSMSFDYNFWSSKLKNLGYNINKMDVSVNFLRDKRAIPPRINLNETYILYSDRLTFDIIFLYFDNLPSRHQASQISRYWKIHQGGRQLIIFSDGRDSYVIVIPGTLYENGVKARTLTLSQKLYRTDIDAINSLKFINDKKILRENYDNNFLPYEKVRNEFFEKYRELYQEIYNNTKEYLGNNASSYAQRFLGRLMFLYFLQKKGWLKNNINFVDTIKNYRELNWVFYNGLSKEGNEGLPYLDGTLFEREDYFTDDIENKINDFMDKIFNRARDLFDNYNFTVDESSPLDREVSLDPNMIGTIFENMLPEHERGEKGTFYTPAEEISFICRRALAGYLKISEKVIFNDNEKEFKDGIEELINNLASEKNESKVRALKDKILNIKVMDPAVGSGGFLLGMMQEMLDLLTRADATVGWKYDPNDYKDQILPNLFGFDIEGEAIEIAKLRIWLSSIIDKKNPEPLISLDMNIIKIDDSLNQIDSVQTKLLDESRPLLHELSSLRREFLHAKSSEKRRELRKELNAMQEEIYKKTGIYGGHIELWTMYEKMDIIVMNPPYVRQEMIPKDKKSAYMTRFKLPAKSDLYAYFIIRSLRLLKEDGIASVITSDKWLETTYGEGLQKRLFGKIISIFSQRERVFGADVNSIIFVYSNNIDRDANTDFIYLESYSSLKILNYNEFKRSDLKCGKWFYLRAPKTFMEYIYPKLTHRLEDFAEIKFGIKTGANDFFYMKDISSQYETDYLSNPDKFKDINAKNENDLKNHGLIYIENESGERFIINKDDVKPLLRSPKQISGFLIKDSDIETLCLYTSNPGIFTKKYIEYGEHKEIPVKGKNKKIIGYNNLESTKNRKPWYKLPNLKPANIILPKMMMDEEYIPYSKISIIVDNTLYALSTKNYDILWLYLNSTFNLTMCELFGRRMGGGVLSIMVDDYNNILVPDLNNIHINFNKDLLLNRKPKIYYEEVKDQTKIDLDKEIAKSLGFQNPEEIINILHDEYVWLVEDRLIKADRPLKSDVK